MLAKHPVKRTAVTFRYGRDSDEYKTLTGNKSLLNRA